jgi:hypothetical protein
MSMGDHLSHQALGGSKSSGRPSSGTNLFTSVDLIQQALASRHDVAACASPCTVVHSLEHKYCTHIRMPHARSLSPPSLLKSPSGKNVRGIKWQQTLVASLCAAMKVLPVLARLDQHSSCRAPCDHACYSHHDCSGNDMVVRMSLLLSVKFLQHC